MSIYGVREQHNLSTLADIIRGNNLPAWEQLGTRIADILRAELPDLDDVTIGRVLVAVGTALEPAFTAGTERSLWAGLTAAGLQLTAQEWEERQ